MGTSGEFREAFRPVQWAASFLDDPDWRVYPHRRTLRPRAADTAYDRFAAVTLQRDDCIQQWAELSQNPAPGSNVVTRTISLFKYGTGLTGYQTICHGGAVMSMMDEGLGNMMLATQREAAGLDQDAYVKLADDTWGDLTKDAESLRSAMKGTFVTAQVSFSFLKPVPSPGVVGVDCTLVEHRGNKMRINAVMKDRHGTPLVRAESLWIRLGRGKL
jgi:acyl-coenzyme A thioesterase PaaI-like protein